MTSREDALRHLRGFQCSQCGKKFGKLYALKRHEEHTRRCGINSKKHEHITPELAQAIQKLQNAKKEELYGAIDECLTYGKYLKLSQVLRTIMQGTRFIMPTRNHRPISNDEKNQSPSRG